MNSDRKKYVNIKLNISLKVFQIDLNLLNKIKKVIIKITFALAFERVKNSWRQARIDQKTK
jgi:hypothetical protein